VSSPTVDVAVEGTVDEPVEKESSAVPADLASPVARAIMVEQSPCTEQEQVQETQEEAVELVEENPVTPAGLAALDEAATVSPGSRRNSPRCASPGAADVAPVSEAALIPVRKTKQSCC